MLPQISNELTKTQIKIIAQNAVDDILENGDVINVSDTITKMELFLKELKSNPKYVEFLRDEVGKYGKSHVTTSGTKIELAEVGTKYDYSQTNDPIYFDLIRQSEQIHEAIKEREQFLKSVSKSGLEILFFDEVIKVYPPSKSSISSYKITIKN
jgi:hypothetical protein